MSELSEFVSERCPICGSHKRKDAFVCQQCFHSLPDWLRHDLYWKLGAALEKTVEAALVWLRNQRKEEQAAMG